ncbi:hypothetical protein LCGC14_2961100 [marine sediment metagenome]|uniref:Uncharacterized protein n=1 Tax=marine sediment metagenome TaxID=412755 RepID=A0A0F8ZJZ7_9ZZZZ
MSEKKKRHEHLSDSDIVDLRGSALQMALYSYSPAQKADTNGADMVMRAEVLFEFLSRERELD